MNISNAFPVLYNIHYFKCVGKDQKYPKIAFPKSQYTYRFIYVTEGKVNVCIGGKNVCCHSGDIVYLLPGEIYRLEPCEGDFSVYSVFFDFLPNRKSQQNKNAGCIFMSDYNEKLCLPHLHFDDACELNESRVFNQVDCIKEWERLTVTDRADPLYDFHARTAIMSVVSRMLFSEKHNNPENAGADSILSYIRLNPDKDLSAAALSELFSYHKNYINHLVKKATGKTLSEYVRAIKIGYAKALLSEGSISLTQIAIELDYYDYSHFYKAFVAETGIAPTEYLLNLRK